VNIGTDGRFREVAALPLLNHQLTEMRHRKSLRAEIYEGRWLAILNQTSSPSDRSRVCRMNLIDFSRTAPQTLA
jgi:hypothetical protein